LIERATTILEGVPALATRRGELQALRATAQADALHVGVVGITSSGKSTFINGLMGESLLPEEARATTNLLVKCRHGDEREAKVAQSNYHDYEVVRMFEAPRIETVVVASTAAPTGVGEPGVPVIAPAVANAVFAATGRRLRELPLSVA
jgi:hypothetical protein